MRNDHQHPHSFSYQNCRRIPWDISYIYFGLIYCELMTLVIICSFGNYSEY